MSINSMDGNATIEDEEALAPLNFWHAGHRPDLFTWIPYSPVPATPRVDQDPANYSQSQEGTSVTNSHVPFHLRLYNEEIKRRVANGSISSDAILDFPTTAEGSIVSYHSTRDLSIFLRERDGRIFNNQSDLYTLPSDDYEFQRLSKQHYSLLLCMGGLTPCPNLVDAALDPARHPNPNDPASVLDLGCGSGIWTLEMALRYPHASVVGIDLAPVGIDMAIIPTNCRFEIDDVTDGLSHYHNRFDVVHVRCITGGIPNFDLMMQDAEACLKPNGIIIFIDGDTRMYLEDNVTPAPVAVDTDEPGGPIQGSWFHRIAREVRYAAAYHGVDIERSETSMDAGLWDHPLIDQMTVRVGSMFTPIGPWASSTDLHLSQSLKYAGSLMRQNCMRLIRAWYPILRIHGIPEDRLELWTKRADEELDEMRYHMSLHWRVTWGKRIPDPPQQPATQPQGAGPAALPQPAPAPAPLPLLGPQTAPLPQLAPAPAPVLAPQPVQAPIPRPAPAMNAFPNLPQPPPAMNLPPIASTSASAANAPAAAALNFQPFLLRQSRADAMQVRAQRIAVGLTLPECLVTRLRSTTGLDESKDESSDDE